MHTRDLDTLGGFCEHQRRWGIRGRGWLSAPEWCGGRVYLVAVTDAEHLLAFVECHSRQLLKQEIAALRAELAPTPTAKPVPLSHAT